MTIENFIHIKHKKDDLCMHLPTFHNSCIVDQYIALSFLETVTSYSLENLKIYNQLNVTTCLLNCVTKSLID